MELEAPQTLLEGGNGDLADLCDLREADIQDFAALQNEGHAAGSEARRHVLLTEAELLHLFGYAIAENHEMFLLCPLKREFTERKGDVFGGLRGRRTRLCLSLAEQPLLACHRQNLLELFEGFREGGRTEAEHLRNVLGLAGAAGFLEYQIHAAGEHRIAAQALASPDLLDGDVHLETAFDDGLVEAVVQADELKAFIGLHEGAFLVGDGVPGVVLAYLVHDLGLALAENHRTERGLGAVGILGCTDTGGIAPAVVVAEESVLCRGVEGAANDFATGFADQEVGFIKTVGCAAIGTGVGIDHDLLFILSPSYDCFDGLRLFLEFGENQFHCLT